MSDSYLVIELNHQPVELCKLLKIADLVSGGGEAKVVISEGYVLLNGEVEYQKRKKVYHEDVIEFNGEVVQLLINEELGESTSEPMEEDSPAAASLNNTLAEIEETNQQDSYPSKTKAAQKKAKSKSKPTAQAKKEKTDSEPISQLDNVKVPRKRKPISF